MSFRKVFAFSVLMGIAISCDVPGTVQIKNNFKQKASVKISYQDKFYKSSITEIEPLKKTELMLGFGTRWNEEYSNSYRNEIVDTIYLTVGQAEYYCETADCKAEIFSLANRRTRKKLQIVIDTNLIVKSFTKM